MVSMKEHNSCGLELTLLENRVVVSRLVKGYSYAWYRSAYSSDPDALWRDSSVAAQQKLGLWSERRVGTRGADYHYPAVHGTYLIPWCRGHGKISRKVPSRRGMNWTMRSRKHPANFDGSRVFRGQINF